MPWYALKIRERHVELVVELVGIPDSGSPVGDGWSSQSSPTWTFFANHDSMLDSMLDSMNINEHQ
jgi:hypothetical protein